MEGQKILVCGTWPHPQQPTMGKNEILLIGIASHRVSGARRPVTLLAAHCSSSQILL